MSGHLQISTFQRSSPLWGTQVGYSHVINSNAGFIFLATSSLSTADFFSMSIVFIKVQKLVILLWVSEMMWCCRSEDLGAAFGLGASDPWWVKAPHQVTVYVVPWAFRTAALGSAVLGALILWGEITAGFPAKLSPLYFVVVATKNEFCAQVRLWFADFDSIA
jgi:hypothetical protein